MIVDVVPLQDSAPIVIEIDAHWRGEGGGRKGGEGRREGGREEGREGLILTVQIF